MRHPLKLKLLTTFAWQNQPCQNSTPCRAESHTINLRTGMYPLASNLQFSRDILLDVRSGFSIRVGRPGGPDRLLDQGSHRSVHDLSYGSSSHGVTQDLR